MSDSSFFNLFTFRAGWSLLFPPEGERPLSYLEMSLFNEVLECFTLDLLSGFLVKKSNISLQFLSGILLVNACTMALN